MFSTRKPTQKYVVILFTSNPLKRHILRHRWKLHAFCVSICHPIGSLRTLCQRSLRHIWWNKAFAKPKHNPRRMWKDIHALRESCNLHGGVANNSFASSRLIYRRPHDSQVPLPARDSPLFDHRLTTSFIVRLSICFKMAAPITLFIPFVLLFTPRMFLFDSVHEQTYCLLNKSFDWILKLISGSNVNRQIFMFIIKYIGK